MKVCQQQLRQKLAATGVNFIDSATVYLCEDTEIAAGAIIEPFVVFGEKVKIAAGCRIKSFSYIENAEIGEDAVIGPFARIRGSSRIGRNAGIGNFVEVARSHIGEGSTAWHLAFIGDAELGKNVEAGAGMITCNFDGFDKHRTIIGDEAFVGSGTVLVAPAMVGKRAMIAAGTTLDEEAASDELAIGRPPLQHKPDGAARYRRRKINNKKP